LEIVERRKKKTYPTEKNNVFSKLNQYLFFLPFELDIEKKQKNTHMCENAVPKIMVRLVSFCIHDEIDYD